MARHIGIVGCSAEGAALCYRTICTEGEALLGDHAHPEITLHTPSFADYVERIDRDDWDAVGELMLASARTLAAAGAEFLICPDNTIHQALPYVLPRSPLPWLHIAEVVAEEAAARGLRRIGILGTRWLAASEVYPRAFSARGIEWMRPAAADCDEVHRVIMDELVRGSFLAPSTESVRRVIAGLREAGCDGVVLGCTELPLILHAGNSPLPVLDSTRLLAHAALRRAVG